MPQCSDDVQQINIRLARVESDVERIKTAFRTNDLGLSDYDGHRLDHRTRGEEARAMQEFKFDATKKILLGVIGVVMTLIGFGIGPYLRNLLGGP